MKLSLRLIPACAVLGLALSAPAYAQFSYRILDDPAGLGMNVVKMNDFGTFVGALADTSQPVFGIAYENVQGATSFLSYPGALSTQAGGVNNLGAVAGAYVISPGIARAFTFDATGYHAYPLPGLPSYGFSDINDAGDKVGTYQNSVGGSPFLLRNDGTLSLVDPVPGSPSQGWGINEAGTISGITGSPSGNVGFTYSTTGIRTFFSFPGAMETGAYDLNSAGQVVGYYYELGATNSRSFIYSAGVYSDISPPGSILSEAFGVNNLGQVTGVFSRSDGILHGYIATPVDEPPIWLLGVGGAILLFIVRRRGNSGARSSRVTSTRTAI